jgi:hypothetical protein
MDKKPLRCRLHLHTWKTERNEEGQRYERCLGCGTTRDKLSLNDFGAAG